MKIAYNPKTAAAITASTAVNDDIIFDLSAKKVWAKGVRMGADWADITNKPSSLPANGGNADTVDNLHASDFVRAYTTSNDNIDSDWGQSFKTFNPIPSGTPPEQSPNISLVSIGDNFKRRKELAFPYNNDNIYYRRHVDNFTSWVKLLHTGNTKVTNGVGSINGTNITQVSNSDTVDSWHKDNIQWTGYITSGTASLSSYWFKMYDVTITNMQYSNVYLTFLVSSENSYSLFQLNIRQNGLNNSSDYKFDVTLKELVGNLKDRIIAYYNNSTGNIQLWGNVNGQWGMLNFTILKKTNRTSSDIVTLGTLTASNFTSVQTQPSDGYTKVTMTRVGQVAQADSATSATTAAKLQTARSFWGNNFDGTQNVNGTITFPSIGDTAVSNKISWSDSTDGADIYYQTTTADQGNLVLNVRDDNNAYIQLALNGTFKSHFDVANSYWTGRSASADKWTTARTFKIGNSSKTVDGSGNVSWTLAEIGVQNTWRQINVNGTSIGTATLNLSNGNYIGVSNNSGKVTFNLIGSTTTANQAILSNGTANGWKLQTLNIDNWNKAWNWVNSVTTADTDGIINKWNEIINFLSGIDSSNKLNTLLNSKLSIYTIANNTDVSTIKNTGIHYSTSDTNSGTLTNSPFANNFALININTLDNGDDLRRARLAFNAHGEIKISNDMGLSNTSETWYNILTSNNSGILGSTIKINGTSITVNSSSAADGKYVKKTGDTMTGSLTIGTSRFEALIAKRNDDANGASIQFRGNSNVYGYIGFNASNKDKQLFRWSSDTSKAFTILDTSSTYVSSGKGYINGNEITQVTNSTLATSANKLNKWFSSRVSDLNQQFGDGALRIFNATSSTTANKCPSDASILHLAWDNSEGWDTQLALSTGGNNIYFRGQNSGTWSTWRTVLHNGNSSVSGNTITINGTSTTWKDTWRIIQVNGTSIGTATLNLKAGNGISISNSSGAVTITNNGVYVQQHTSNDTNYPLVWSNQSNSNSVWGQQLYKSWSDLYYNPKNKRLQVGGSIIAGGVITAPGFKHSSVTSNANQYVLTADGGYTLLNQIANEGVYTFSKDITVTDTWADIDGFYGGNDAFLVSTGTYIVQVYYKTSFANNMWDGYFSGIMSWYTGKTNSNNADEIVLHRAGHAYGNTIYLRTAESPNTDDKPYTKLQISANKSLSQNTYTFKFKRIC